MRGFLQSLRVGLLLIISVAKPATADPIRVTLDARNVAVVAKVNDLPGRSSEIAPQDVFVSFDEAVTVADAQGSVSAQSTAPQQRRVASHYPGRQGPSNRADRAGSGAHA
jgi:hypothetical protein